MIFSRKASCTAFYRSSEETKLERVARMNKTAIFRFSSAKSLFNVHLLSAQADAGFFFRLKTSNIRKQRLTAMGAAQDSLVSDMKKI